MNFFLIKQENYTFNTIYIISNIINIMHTVNIDRIINEQINRFVFESTKQMTSKEDFEERARKAHKRDGAAINKADSSDIIDFLDNEYINTSKVIQKATGLESTSASSIGSKIINGERKVTQRLANTVAKIRQDLK